MTRIMRPLIERFGAVAVRGAVARAQRSLWAPPGPRLRKRRRKEALERKLQREMARAAAVEAAERAAAAAVTKAREEAEAEADKLRRSRLKLRKTDERLAPSITKSLSRHKWQLNRTGRTLDLALMRLKRTPEHTAAQALRNAGANAGIAARLDAKLRMLAPILMDAHRRGRFQDMAYELYLAGIPTARGGEWRQEAVRKVARQIADRLTADPDFLHGAVAGTVEEWRELGRGFSVPDAAAP